MDYEKTENFVLLKNKVCKILNSLPKDKHASVFQIIVQSQSEIRDNELFTRKKTGETLISTKCLNLNTIRALKKSFHELSSIELE